MHYTKLLQLQKSPLLQANYDQSVNELSLCTRITIVLVYPTYLQNALEYERRSWSHE